MEKNEIIAEINKKITKLFDTKKYVKWADIKSLYEDDDFKLQTAQIFISAMLKKGDIFEPRKNVFSKLD